MSELKINGVVKVIMETQTFDSGFQKREFVLTTLEQYPQDVKLEFLKDKCELLDSINVGDNLDVSFNVRGNEYNDRYFVNLQAWKMVKGGEATPTTPKPAVMAVEEDETPF